MEETREQTQARHRRELKELQGRITSKKKNATKKTRKGVNDECAELERAMRETQSGELAALAASAGASDQVPEPAATTGLEEATQNLHIEQQQQQQASSETETQPGKKRNRQKERLARRAAEQEAAAIRAEEEAASMTDHRATESKYMKETIAKQGLTERDIAPDGHCLFASVADGLQQLGVELGEPAYKTVRSAAADYMSQHGDDFAPFLDEDLSAHVARIRDTAEWGGQLELMALAKRYNAQIRVVQDGRTEIIGDDGERTLWVAYYRHGYGLGEHYNSLRKA